MNRLLRSAAMFSLIAFGLSGCVTLAKEYPRIRTYALEAQRPERRDAPVGMPLLLVEGFSAAPQCDGDSFMLRVGDAEYQEDFYRRFIDRPAPMVREAAARWLADGGSVRVEAGPAAAEDAAYRLRGRLVELYVDTRTSPHRAVVGLELTVQSQAPDGALGLTLHRLYESSQPINGGDGEEAAAALDAALADILTRFETDFAAAR